MKYASAQDKMIHIVDPPIREMHSGTDTKPVWRQHPMLPETIYLIDRNQALVEAWEQAFADFDEVVPIQDDFLSQPADALVSPANSFGFMDGGLDKVIRDRLLGGIQQRVQKMIVTQFYGEIPIGSASIVETDHKHWPYLVVAPTMRIPERVAHTNNAYLAFRALLIAILRFNQAAQNPIQTVVVPGLCTGWGAMEPRRCAAQMRIAFNYISKPPRIPSMNEIHTVHNKLKLV